MKKLSYLSCVCPKSGRLLVEKASDDFIGKGYSFRVVKGGLRKIVALGQENNLVLWSIRDIFHLAYY